MHEPILSVEIIAVPPGEAPEEIRRAWVGLTLPLALSARVVNVGLGVLTAPRTFLGQLLHLLLGKGKRQEGYLVPAATAIAILERVNPDAARWWREKTPHLLMPGRNFLFAAEACREITTYAVPEGVWPPPPRTD